jgi:hypothetical protein
MTPKEKCKKLIIKFSPLVTTWNCYNDAPESDDIILRDAKKCALIAVDEIINNGGTIFVVEYPKNTFRNGTDYWEEVKKEIELL